MGVLDAKKPGQKSAFCDLLFSNLTDSVQCFMVQKGKKAPVCGLLQPCPPGFNRETSDMATVCCRSDGVMFICLFSFTCTRE